MSASKKELILKRLEAVIAAIQLNTKPTEFSDVYYENSVCYVDRQYSAVTIDDIESRPMPWVIINNEGEEFNPLPSRNFDNIIKVQIVGFVKLLTDTQNLDTMMNCLQKDLLVAILTDETLSHLCTYVMPQRVYPVEEMINPMGGFVIELDINYSFTGTSL